MKIFLKKVVFLAGTADWLSDLPSVIKNYNNIIHSSAKMIPTQASKKSIEKAIFSNLPDKRETPKPKFNLGKLNRTADF